jgi:hypothetical protein
MSAASSAAPTAPVAERHVHWRRWLIGALLIGRARGGGESPRLGHRWLVREPLVGTSYAKAKDEQAVCRQAHKARKAAGQEAKSSGADV